MKSLYRHAWGEFKKAGCPAQEPFFVYPVNPQASAGLVVDHIDHDGLNNTRKNLRLCTAEQNHYNRRPRKGSTSKYKGVSWNTEKHKFCAKIAYAGKQHHLGCFTDDKEAARAYDKKANEFFGEFAYLNFPADCAEGVSGDKSADPDRSPTGPRAGELTNYEPPT